MIRALTRLPPAQTTQARAFLPHDPRSDDTADSPAEVLRQALSGFLPPSAALFHLFDRMETQR